MEERLDSQTLSSFYRNFGNQNAVNNYFILNQTETEELYRSHRHVQNIINLIPEDTTSSLPIWELDKGDTQDILAAFKQVEAFGEPLQTIDIWGAFELAMKYARQYGDGFLFIGVDDGLDPVEPVDWKRVKSIDWVKAFHRYEVGLDYRRECFIKTLDKQRQGEGEPSIYFHRSRVIRFPGIQLYGLALASNGGFNDSVLNAVFKQHCSYLEAVNASANMLKSHSVFKYGIKGLRSLLTRKTAQQEIKSRFESLMLGLSTVGGLIYDADGESGEFINRNYGGVKDILEHLQDVFISVSGMPRSKVFGNAAIGAMSEASEGDRWNWNEIIDRNQNSKLKPAQMYLTKLILASQGKYETEFDIKYHPHYQLTEQQQAELKKANAETDKIYIDAGVLDRQEVRDSRFANSDYGNAIVLNQYEVPDPTSNGKH